MKLLLRVFENQEYLASLLIHLDYLKLTLVLCFGTDGTEL